MTKFEKLPNCRIKIEIYTPEQVDELLGFEKGTTKKKWEEIYNTIEKQDSMITDLNQLADTVHANARNHGFHPEDEPLDVFVANQCNNMHGEIQELWDSWRRGEQQLPCDKPIPLNQTAEELADIIIRALDVSRRLGVDIVEAVNLKHKYNTTRPFKHGKKN